MAKSKNRTTVSLAVKYRPRCLEDLVGQDSVTTQINGMVKLGRFPTTIGLFGESGSGKTTLSRMLAHYINCLKPTEEGKPCGECASCKYGEGHPDLHEINMADNRGIDDIRALIQSAKSMPSLGNKRVFILDEVHSCFTADTKVLLADGSFRTMEQIGKMIKAEKTVEVMSLDLEWEPDLDNPEHPKTPYQAKRVSAFLPKMSRKDGMVRVHMANDCYFDCTYDHKIWSDTQNGWVKASELQKGERLKAQHHICMDTAVVRVEKVEGPSIEVYDLTVEDNHNYYVLPKGSVVPVLVSNCTPQAFQTLLKPLEDAPEHTVWILATTDPQKLPSTIVGRCHVFSIRPIPEEAIVKRLRQIAKREGTDFKEMEGGKEILKTIANMSSGRMRNSIVALESVLFALASGKEFSTEQLISQFARTTDADMDKAAAQFVGSVFAGDAKAVIQQILRAGNVRALLMKSRYLLLELMKQAAGENFWRTYSWKCFNEVVKMNKDKVRVTLSLVLEFQALLCEIEMRLNSVSIDETVLFTSSVGKFLVEKKKG